MLDEQDRELAPFLPTLQQFAADNGLTLRRPSPDNEAEWTRYWYQCQLGFLNARHQLCYLYVDRYPSLGFQVRLQRWGVHDLEASQVWKLPYEASPAELLDVLAQAYAEANAGDDER
jgi:hypothetical protein